MALEDVFNAAYWAAQPPEIRALKDDPNRASRAIALAAQGFPIDVPIDVYGWSPYLVMFLRVQGGYTWVPSALQPPVMIAPGLGAGTLTPYDPAHPPAGSIKVSLDLKDYPPFLAVPGPVAGAYVIGPMIAAGLPLFYAFDSEPDGFVVHDDGVMTGPNAHPAGTYTRHRQIVAVTPFGAESNNWYQLA